MPNWGDVLKEIQQSPKKNAIDCVRRKYLKQYYNYTGRNVIAYYSGWLNKEQFA